MPEPFETVVIGVGGNLGDRLAAFNSAARMLVRLPGCRNFHFSHLYETEPVDCPEPLPFLNGIVGFQSSLSPHQIFQCLKTIERVLGRASSYRNARELLTWTFCSLEIGSFANPI